MTRSSILVLEDDPGISQFVCASLSAAGMAPRAAASVPEAEDELARSAADLLIVDLGLPGEDGLSFICRLRRSDHAPILVLSARSAEWQKIEALDAGADDFLAKPFGVGELLARVRAMLRRAAAPPKAPQAFSVGDLAFDTKTRELRLSGRLIRLTPRETALFEALAKYPGRVRTHRQLLSEVWGADHVDQLHYLRIYMGHLRSKIEEDPAEPRYLLTELGVGYRLADE